jgi:hypothetical protein
MEAVQGHAGKFSGRHHPFFQCVMSQGEIRQLVQKRAGPARVHVSGRRCLKFFDGFVQHPVIAIEHFDAHAQLIVAIR